MLIELGRITTQNLRAVKMVDMTVETTEPDPSATAIANDQTIDTSQNKATPDAPKETTGMSAVSAVCSC